MLKSILVFTVIWSIAGVSTADSRGEDFLLAAKHDLTRVVQHLVDEGIDPNLRQEDTGVTALMLAALFQKDNARTVEALLAAGAELTAQDREGYSALSYAVLGGSAAAVRCLIEAGADVDARSASGTTVLDLAQWSGETEIARLLLEAGARGSDPEAPEAARRAERERWTARIEALEDDAVLRPLDAPKNRLLELETTLELWEQVPRFPWPPPRASASHAIPRHLVTSGAEQVLFQDVAAKLERVLDSAGYFERGWFAVPEGFALVSRIEQINADASSKTPPDRWSIDVASDKVFSLRSYLEALFRSQPGYFRVIVFIVSSHAVTEDPTVKVTREKALEWVSRGASSLPASLLKADFTDDHACSALIYEFEQLSADSTPKLREPSPHLGRDHLQQARLLGALAAVKG